MQGARRNPRPYATITCSISYGGRLAVEPGDMAPPLGASARPDISFRPDGGVLLASAEQAGTTDYGAAAAGRRDQRHQSSPPRCALRRHRSPQGPKAVGFGASRRRRGNVCRSRRGLQRQRRTGARGSPPGTASAAPGLATARICYLERIPVMFERSPHGERSFCIPAD